MHSYRFAKVLLVASLLATGGCSSWRIPSYDISKLRDPRAVDIDSRMALPPPTSGSRSE